MYASSALTLSEWVRAIADASKLQPATVRVCGVVSRMHRDIAKTSKELSELKLQVVTLLCLAHVSSIAASLAQRIDVHERLRHIAMLPWAGSSFADSSAQSGRPAQTVHQLSGGWRC